MKEIAVGIDIGGTNTKFGIIDREGNCLTQKSIETHTHKEASDFLDALYKEVDIMLRDLGNSYELKGIGIGAPNGNYYNGTIEQAPNLRWKGIVKLVEMSKKYYDVTIALTNDANAAAMGEMIYGGAKGMRDFIEITLGTGLGSGIVVNGELVYGHDGFAGEIGHTLVDPFNGRQCGCGRCGCLETYVSATGIKRTVYELLASSLEESELRSVCFNDLNSKMIAEAAQRGDKIALEAFDYSGKVLGIALADTVAHTSPKAIFLFGGLANAGDLIFNPTKKYLEQYLLNIFKNKVKVLPSGLDGANAAIMGASALVWRELDK